LRAQFLTELSPHKILTLTEINHLLWAWIDQIYHPTPHSSLQGKTPLTVWQNGLASIKPLGTLAHQLDEIFYHRVERKVRKDSTISYAGKIYDVSYGLAQKQVFIVIEPHEERALYIENEQGDRIGDIYPTDLQANRHSKRGKSKTSESSSITPTSSLAELALLQQQEQLSLPLNRIEKKQKKTHNDK